MMAERPNYVAVGLLTQADLDLLGSGFRAAIPLDGLSDFEGLLEAIDAAVTRSVASHRL
jgi:hypothetical protein